MHLFRHICFSAVAFGSMSAAAVTVEPEDSIDDLFKEAGIDLEAVTVTATRTPRLLKDAPVITRLITATDMRRSDATNIGDLLQTELPGIEFSYSMNQQTSLNMQGFGGNAVLFLVDGERLAGETLDNIDYSRLNLTNLDRVEIVKGASSALYGSNAVGGVVNLISAEPRNPWELNLNARYGAHNAQRYGAQLGLRGGRVSSVTSAQFVSSDAISLKTSVSEGGDYNQVYGHHSWNIKERLVYRPIDALTLTGRLGYFFRQRDSQPSSRDRYRDFTGGLRGVWQYSRNGEIELSYGYDQYDKSDFLIASSRDLRDYSNVQHTAGARWTMTCLPQLTLTAGGDFLRDYLMSYQFEGNGSHRQITVDGYAQAEWDVTSALNLIGGLRYDYYSEARADHLSAKVGAMYKMRPFTFRASYSGGFRAPTLKEMYMNFDMANIFMIYGNPDLKSETSNNFSLSAEYARGNYNLTAAGFYNLVDNRITTAWNTSLAGQQYVNTAPLRIGGLELNAYGRWRNGFGARVSYAFTREVIRKGEPLTSSTRPHTATLRLDWQHKWRDYSLDVALHGRVLSAVTVDEFTSLTSYEETEKVRYPAYTMWKLNVNQTVWKGIGINLTVDNLLNYRPKYYYSSSPTTTGTNLAIGVTLDIDRMTR